MSKKKRNKSSKRYNKNKSRKTNLSKETATSTEKSISTKVTIDSPNTEHTTAIESVEKQIAETGYPDISKANTNWIVIISLISVLIIFLLAILFPNSTKGVESSTTESTTEIATTEEKFLGTLDEKTGFTHLDGYIYYYEDGNTPYTGWLTKDGSTYYFNKEGIMITDVWYVVDSKQYYFQENGAIAINQWVGNHYLDENGQKMKNAFSPDGFWLDADGNRDNTISLETSIEGLTDLKSQLEELMSGYYGEWSIYVKNLSTNEYLAINNIQHYSASLIKLYCGATIYDLINKDILEESDNITTLMHSMISISNNDAFNLLVGKCSPNHDGSQVSGRKIIQEYIDANGYKDTTIATMLVPTKYRSPSSPGRNYTTVVDCGLFLESIYRQQCVSEEASQKFIDLLLDQSHIWKIPAGLPEGTKCANKTGDTDVAQHDVAIVYSPNCDYIVSVMSTNGGAAIHNIQNLSRTIYNYFNPEATTNDSTENDSLKINETTTETVSYKTEESSEATTETTSLKTEESSENSIQ